MGSIYKIEPAKLIEEINARQGIRTPIICTPEELMEG